MPKVLHVGSSSWSTPATSFPLRSRGRARIVRTFYTRGLYHMEGIGGYDYYYVEDVIPITTLKVGGTEWMVDDPPHWLGMQLIARRCAGRVLCAGLGLGLILFALRGNQGVTSVDMLEKEEDVIKLMKPLIPRCRILEGDFWRFEDFRAYDTIFVDIWSGYETGEKVAEMRRALRMIKLNAPRASVFIWGLKDMTANPALCGPLQEGEQGPCSRPDG